MDRQQSEYRQQRLENMQKLISMGRAAYGGRFERTANLATIREGFEEEKPVCAAGRLITIRAMGKAVFADLHDGSDRFQIFVQKNQVGDEAFAAFQLLDAGDHIGVSGRLFTTRKGEPTLKVQQWEMLAKALQPLPEKWHGLKDVEARYRQRYLDLIANEASRIFFRRRSQAVQEIRRYLFERGFLEVETPMMQPQAGGAAARPFVTHYTALDTDMYLRIAPELYLKQLLVGGMDRIFELNRNFRNEGLSRTHNPEFTMLEIYQAYSDVSGMKELVQGMIVHLAQEIFGTLEIQYGEHQINLTPPWREVTYGELVTERMGEDWFSLDLEAARARTDAAGLPTDPAWGLEEITHEVYEKLVEKTLIQPTFVTRFPAALVPLAKKCPEDPTVVDVFELEIGGQEIAPAYSEMNDPLEQRRRFEAQAGEDAEKVDEEFLLALEHGMPPAGGMGIGVDRLLMILSGQEAIRDVILFPQLRPRS